MSDSREVLRKVFIISEIATLSALYAKWISSCLRANRQFEWAKLTISSLQIDGLLSYKSTVCSSEVVNFGV